MPCSGPSRASTAAPARGEAEQLAAGGLENALLGSFARFDCGACKGIDRSSLDARKPRNQHNEVKNTRGIFRVCCSVHEGHKRKKR